MKNQPFSSVFGGVLGGVEKHHAISDNESVGTKEPNLLYRYVYILVTLPIHIPDVHTVRAYARIEKLYRNRGSRFLVLGGGRDVA